MSHRLRVSGIQIFGSIRDRLCKWRQSFINLKISPRLSINLTVVFFHRLILATVLVSSKMNNDTFYTNSYIAHVGGVSLDNIN